MLPLETDEKVEIPVASVPKLLLKIWVFIVLLVSWTPAFLLHEIKLPPPAADVPISLLSPFKM